jgi:hypothetical protein
VISLGDSVIDKLKEPKNATKGKTMADSKKILDNLE